VGTCFIVVNPAKRQYLDPMRFGEGMKYSVVLRGDYCLSALQLLISDVYKRDATSFEGAWLGDPILLAGDDSGLPNPGNLITATSADPRRNLHALATEEFTNISYRAIAELCLDKSIARSFAERADRGLLMDLCAVIEQFQPGHLEYELEQATGGPWRKAYSEVRAELNGRRTLPAIDWPL
jgi:hypothetical protein